MRRLLLACALLGATTYADPGEAAADYSCNTWTNLFGADNPTPKSLKGKHVLLEFWFST